MPVKKVKNPYRKGAEFERDMVKWLQGEGKTDYDVGFLHHAIAAGVPKKMWDDMSKRFTICASRYAGSKGKGGVDISVVITLFRTSEKKKFVKQWAIGVQCKTDKPTLKEIRADMRKMARVGGVIPMYITKVPNKTATLASGKKVSAPEIYNKDWWDNFLEGIAVEAVGL